MMSLQESMEAIAFQRDLKFPTLLTGYFEELIATEQVHEMVPTLQKIADLTYDVTGVMSTFIVTQAPPGKTAPYRASIKMPDFNAFSPLNRGAIKRLEAMDFANVTLIDLIDGKLDRKTGKMSGWFSTIGVEITFCDRFMHGAFSGAEICALYLHELGHFWTMCEFMGETVSTSVVLAEIVGRMDTQETVDKRFEFVQAAMKITGANPNVPKDINTAEVFALLVKAQGTRMQNRAGSRWYDIRLAEVISDQYVSRWMMGSALATALGKLERGKGLFAEAGYDPVWIGVTTNFLNVVAFPFSSIGKGVSIVVFEAVKNLMWSFGVSLGLNTLIFGISEKGYNTTLQRVAQQRRELVGLLRDKSLSDAEVKRALTDIDTIDKELDKVHNLSDIWGTITRYAIDVFSGVRNENHREIEKEELANNRLYELAASLRG
jgi:hypothetical protein